MEVEAEFVRGYGDFEHGFYLRVNGWIQLEGGEHIDLLRTWYDPRYEDSVRRRGVTARGMDVITCRSLSRPFHSNHGPLRVWNVYRTVLPNGRTVDDKWTGDAGLWVERIDDRERIYHCSPGPLGRA